MNRKCIVYTKDAPEEGLKAYLHCIGTSVMITVNGLGQLQHATPVSVAVVEYEDGKMDKVEIGQVKMNVPTLATINANPRLLRSKVAIFDEYDNRADEENN